MTIDSARRSIFAKDRIDKARGEKPGEQRTERAARAVNSESIKRVVVAEPGFHSKYHEGTESSCQQSDQKGGEGLNKPGRGGNGDKAGNRA